MIKMIFVEYLNNNVEKFELVKEFDSMVIFWVEVWKFYWD